MYAVSKPSTSLRSYEISRTRVLVESPWGAEAGEHWIRENAFFSLSLGKGPANSLQRSEAENKSTPLRLQLLRLFTIIMLAKTLSGPLISYHMESQGETNSRFPKPLCQSRRCTENHRGYTTCVACFALSLKPSPLFGCGLAVACLRVANCRL